MIISCFRCFDNNTFREVFFPKGFEIIFDRIFKPFQPLIEDPSGTAYNAAG